MIEHVFALIGCLLIPGFELRAALRARPALALRPAALATGAPGSRDLRVGPVTEAARAAGVRAGMRLGEALATCPSLVLVDQDPAGAEQAWGEILRALEGAGFAVEPAEPGCAYFDTRGVERLYGGVAAALRRALAAVGSSWDARAGAASRRFAALSAASVARPAQALVVEDERTHDFLAPLPATLLPLDDERLAELHELGVRRLGELAGLPGAAVADRLGPDGRRAWSLARGGGGSRVAARAPLAEIVEPLRFPAAVANELVLRRALGVLAERALARPERREREVRKVALAARLVGGGSWRRTVTLREATADAARLRTALGPKLAELPAPVKELRLELVELGKPSGRQLELLKAEGEELKAKLQDGLRQARASAGAGAVCSVVEVAPWSRIPEQRALLVPREG